jgi:hypothetical protein
MSKGKDEDKDDGEEYLHIGKKVDMKGAEDSLLLGVRIQMRKKREVLQKKQLQLCCCVIKIRDLCSKVIKGYSKHYKELNSHLLPKQHLKKIKLLFNQRIECRCAEYNST